MFCLLFFFLDFFFFSPFEGWSVLLMIFFAVGKLMHFIRSHLFILVYIYIHIYIWSKKIFYDLCQRMFCLFSSKNFIVVGLILMYLIHFEFIFVYGARECSNFICKHISAQISQLHLLKSLVLSTLYVFVSFVID